MFSIWGAVKALLVLPVVSADSNALMNKFNHMMGEGGALNGFDPSRIQDPAYINQWQSKLKGDDLANLENLIGNGTDISDLLTALRTTTVEDTRLDLIGSIRGPTPKDHDLIYAVVNKTQTAFSKEELLKHIMRYIGYPSDKLFDLWWKGIHFKGEEEEKNEEAVGDTERGNDMNMAGQKKRPKPKKAKEFTFGTIGNVITLISDIIEDPSRFYFEESREKVSYGTASSSFQALAGKPLPEQYRIPALKKLKEMFDAIPPYLQRSKNSNIIVRDKSGAFNEKNVEEKLEEPLTSIATTPYLQQIMDQLLKVVTKIIQSAPLEIELDYRIGAVGMGGDDSGQLVSIYKSLPRHKAEIAIENENEPVVHNLTINGSVVGRQGLATLFQQYLYDVIEDVHAMMVEVSSTGGDVDAFINELTIKDKEDGSDVVTEILENRLKQTFECISSEYTISQNDAQDDERLQAFESLIATEQFRYLPRVITEWTRRYSISLDMNLKESSVDVFKRHFPYCSFANADQLPRSLPSYSLGTISENLDNLKKTGKHAAIAIENAKANIEQGSKGFHFLGDHLYKTRRLTMKPKMTKIEENQASALEDHHLLPEFEGYEWGGQFEPEKNMVFLGCGSYFKFPFIKQVIDSEEDEDKLKVYQHQYCCNNYYSQRATSLSVASQVSDLEGMLPGETDTSNLFSSMKSNKTKEPEPPACCKKFAEKYTKQDHAWFRSTPIDDTPLFDNRKLNARYMKLQKVMLGIKKCPTVKMIPMGSAGSDFPTELDAQLTTDEKGNEYRLKKPLAILEQDRQGAGSRWETDVKVKMIDNVLGEEVVITPRLARTALLAFDIIDKPAYDIASEYEKVMLFTDAFFKLDDRNKKYTSSHIPAQYPPHPKLL